MKKVISILLMILLVLCTTKVQAASDSFNTTLTINNSQAKRGDTITVTIGLKDIAIESGEKGIGAYTAEIKFDSSVLEYVSADGVGKWEAPLYQDGYITSNTNDAEVVTTTQNIATITFKVKENASLGETSVSVANFSGSALQADILASSNGSAKLTIVDNNNNNGSGNNGTGNNGSSSNGQKENVDNKGTQKNSNTIVAQNVLPKAGKQSNPFLRILYLLIGLSLIGTIGTVYVLKKKDN